MLPVHLNRQNLQNHLMEKNLQLILWQSRIRYPMCLILYKVNYLKKSLEDNKNMANDMSDNG